MRILIIGANGTIGNKVASYFSQANEIIIAGRNSGDVFIDIANPRSITEMFKNVGSLDAIISIAGEAKWAPFEELTEEDYYVGLKSKLMGQVNLVRIGKDYLKPNGSVTLTTGILADHPVRMTTSAAMVNGAIHSFVKAVILELDHKIRVNVVCPGLAQDSAEKYKDYFPSHKPVPMDHIVKGYIKSVEGNDSGEIIRIYS
ncbi:MAG: short chain dehydrogenase [Saonia sp.]